MFNPDHVLLWNALCNDHHQPQLCINSFHDGSCSKARRDVHNRGFRTCCCFGLHRHRHQKIVPIHKTINLYNTSATVLKTGNPRWVEPPFPGDTPPTMFVPYAIACSLCTVPYREEFPSRPHINNRQVRIELGKLPVFP